MKQLSEERNNYFLPFEAPLPEQLCLRNIPKPTTFQKQTFRLILASSSEGLENFCGLHAHQGFSSLNDPLNVIITTSWMISFPHNRNHMRNQRAWGRFSVILMVSRSVCVEAVERLLCLPFLLYRFNLHNKRSRASPIEFQTQSKPKAAQL